MTVITFVDSEAAVRAWINANASLTGGSTPPISQGAHLKRLHSARAGGPVFSAPPPEATGAAVRAGIPFGAPRAGGRAAPNPHGPPPSRLPPAGGPDTPQQPINPRPGKQPPPSVKHPHRHKGGRV